MLFLAAILGSMADPLTFIVLALVALISRPWWGVLLAVVGLVAGGAALRLAGDGDSPSHAALMGLAGLIGYSIVGFGIWKIKDVIMGKRGKPVRPVHTAVSFEDDSASPENRV